MVGGIFDMGLAAVTVTLMLALRVWDPFVPLTTTTKEPVPTELATLTVMVEDRELEMAELVKLVVMPVGRIGVESVTVPVNTLIGLRAIVEVPEDPC